MKSLQEFEESDRLRQLINDTLEHFGATRGQLAQKLGKSAAAITQVLSGDTTMRNDTKHRLLVGLAKLLQGRIRNLTDDRLLPFIQHIQNQVHLAGDTIYFTREDLDAEVDLRILQARSSIVFLGGIPERKMTNDWYQALARRLLDERELQILVVIESLQNSYWVSKSLNNAVQRNTRRYSDMLQKYANLVDDMQRVIFSYVRSELKNDKEFEETCSRFRIREANIPIYSYCTRADDTLFWTPRSHLRASLGATAILRKQDDIRWKQANEYVEFFKALEKDNCLVTAPQRFRRNIAGESEKSPGSEKVAVYSVDDLRTYETDWRVVTVRGVLSKSALEKDTSIVTREVHGFVINRSGRILLQRTADEENHRIVRHDRSFGGNIDLWEDRSSTDAAVRLLRQSVHKPVFNQASHQDKDDDRANPLPFVRNAGEWETEDDNLMENLVALYLDRAYWTLFLLRRAEKFPIGWNTDDPETLIQRPRLVDIFIAVSNQRFDKFFDRGTGKITDQFEWVSAESIESLENTRPDLRSYIRSRDLMSDIKHISQIVHGSDSRDAKIY